uniref:Uncharacterized protein n=1 Tax=Candidatus Methanogaster sp. ANME-2c ERB4 TaxID=2759911 RepID=A0A7G9YPC9_9EURY|nr:hypothetical protein HMIKAMFF_00023 [Methanosarcinales archaeon ANME-2c ERB4]
MRGWVLVRASSRFGDDAGLDVLIFRIHFEKHVKIHIKGHAIHRLM